MLLLFPLCRVKKPVIQKGMVVDENVRFFKYILKFLKGLIKTRREMECCQDVQMDFPALDIEYSEFTTPEDNPHLSSDSSSADSCHANSMNFEYNGQVQSVLNLGLVSADGPTQTTDDSIQTTATEEPIRRLRPLSGPAPQPKRFFRSFWRGLSMRAVSREQLKSCMDE